MAEGKVKAIVWSEFTEPEDVYPMGIHGDIAEYLNSLGDVEAKVAQIDDPEQGISEAALEWADVLIWWGHLRHKDVTDENVQRIVRHVKEKGMGYFPIHSAHYSSGLIALMGTGCGLGSVSNDGGAEFVSVVSPDHPIAQGIEDFTVPQTEAFGEPFDVPEPDVVVFRTTYEMSDAWFRSGCCWNVGRGRVFYFRPGHETFRIMRQPEVQKVIHNGALWAARRT